MTQYSNLKTISFSENMWLITFQISMGSNVILGNCITCDWSNYIFCIKIMS